MALENLDFKKFIPTKYHKTLDIIQDITDATDDSEKKPDSNSNIATLKNEIVSKYLVDWDKREKLSPRKRETIQEYLLSTWDLLSTLMVSVFWKWFLSDKLLTEIKETKKILKTSSESELLSLKNSVINWEINNNYNYIPEYDENIYVEHSVADSKTKNTKTKKEQPITVPETDLEKQRKNKVLSDVHEKVWCEYHWWSTWPDQFDCSGIRDWAFKKNWLKTPRFTAEWFDKKDRDISTNNVQVWDFMYREQEPWKKKHRKIYHIEMVVWLPFEKTIDGKKKMFVKTLWSASNWGVWYRQREITQYRHFGRHTFFQDLAMKNWNIPQNKNVA